MTDWDPVSRQPIFKVAAVRVEKLADGDGLAPAPTTTASAPVVAGVPQTAGGTGVRETVEGPGRGEE